MGLQKISAQVELRGQAILFRRTAIPFHRFIGVCLHADAFGEATAQIILRSGAARLGSGAIPTRGFRFVGVIFSRQQIRQVRLSGGVIFFGGFGEPFLGDVQIFIRAASLRAAEAEVELRGDVALLGGFAKPTNGLGFVGVHAGAFGETHAQIILRQCEALLGGFRQQRHAFGFIGGHAVAAHEPPAEDGLGASVAQFGGFAIPFERGR